uniref:Uncharacterized protein n=1 Tax=Oryza brachyantha TaxID=4533 RepID=J3N105_ORYBR
MALLPCIAIAVLLSSSLAAAVTGPPGTIERITKQQILASIPPGGHGAGAGDVHPPVLFLTSPAALAPVPGDMSGDAALAPLPGALGGVDPALAPLPGDISDPTVAGAAAGVVGAAGTGAGAVAATTGAFGSQPLVDNSPYDSGAWKIDGHLAAIVVALFVGAI